MFRSTQPWWLPGALLVLFGLVIVAFPDLLALMVASALIVIGAAWLSIAYSARKLTRGQTQVYRYGGPTRWF